MRPSDENQRGSTRPKLKSSKRSAKADGNILASLEHIPAGKAMQPTEAGPPLPWLLAGGGVVLVLIASIAWLAHVNATTVRPLPKADSQGHAAPLIVDRQPTPRMPAAIIDEPAERAMMLAQASMAPLVMMPAAAPAQHVVREAAVKLVAAPRPGPARAATAKKPRVQRAPAPAPEAVDSDIALISAIVAHASGHTGERTQAGQTACQPGRKCTAKGPNQP